MNEEVAAAVAARVAASRQSLDEALGELLSYAPELGSRLAPTVRRLKTSMAAIHADATDPRATAVFDFLVFAAEAGVHLGVEIDGSNDPDWGHLLERIETHDINMLVGGFSGFSPS